METKELTKKDFVTDQEVRWCPGCGDYAILAATQMAMAKLGVPKEKYVCVSGIGCSSRFPYYMNTYGLHTIHGRAPTIATGMKLHNPDLKVWIFTGDGDSLSIGGNHFIHLIRKNIDVNLILFNNEIYGLTKGQYSPTSRAGTVSKSTPFGSIDNSFTPASLALGAGATFFARTLDTDPKHMQEVFIEASKHKGISIVEVLQNCVIFNDKIHDVYTNKETRPDTTIQIEDGKPLIFGKDKDKCLVIDGFSFKVKSVQDVSEKDIAIHDSKNLNLAHALASLHAPEFPLALGVLRQVTEATYEDNLEEQIKVVTSMKGEGRVSDLLFSGDTWEVK